MDILSLIGLVLAACAILIGAVLKGAGIHSLVSGAAFMIVVVGTIASICIQTPLHVMKRALAILPWVFSPPAVERVTKDVFPVEAATGDLLIREGDPGDLFYVIVEGKVEITRAGNLVSEQGPGAYVGEIALLRDVPRTASVIAKTPLRLLALEREPFLLAVTGHPGSHEAARAVTSARMA